MNYIYYILIIVYVFFSNCFREAEFSPFKKYYLLLMFFFFFDFIMTNVLTIQ